MVNWDKFNNLLKNFTFRSAQVIKDVYLTLEYPKVAEWTWYQDKSGYLRREKTEIKEHSIAVFECQEIIEKLNEYRVLISYIKSERALNDLMNGFEITPSSISSIKDRYIIQHFLSVFLARKESNHEIENCYNQLYSDFKAALQRKRIKRKIVAHLYGFISDIDQYKFENGITLEKFSFNDLNNTYRDEFYINGNYSQYCHFLTATYNIPREISKSRPSRIRSSPPSHDIISNMQYIVNIIRLFKPGYIEVDHFFDTSVNFEIEKHGVGMGKNSEEFIERPLLLNKNELNKFDKFYNNFKVLKTMKTKNLDNSFRWLSNISIKQNIDDKFLDYMIVLESLYLEGEQELAYRLALRASYLLGNNLEGRIKYFKILRKAYNLRSGMVHQGESLPQKIEIEGHDFNTSFSKKSFVENIEEIVYLTIEKIVNDYMKFPVCSGEWDKLILSGG